MTFFVGENGSGKSTLLEAVADVLGFNPEGGGRDHQDRDERDDRDDLASALKLSWLPKVTDGFFMRAESFFNFASYLDQVSTLERYGGRSLHEQSHGESFLALFANRFDRGIYLLDEPEAALSPQRQLAFLRRSTTSPPAAGAVPDRQPLADPAGLSRRDALELGRRGDSGSGLPGHRPLQPDQRVPRRARALLQAPVRG